MAAARGLVAEYGEDMVQAHIVAGFRTVELEAKQAPAVNMNDNGVDNNYLEARAQKRTSTVRPARRLVSRRASEIKPRDVEFLWDGRLARGKHSCEAGEPGSGKSQISCAIAATVSTGGEWPCNEGRAPLGSVIILNAEDDADDTIVPRLMAAGADLDRVHIVSAVRGEDGKGNRTFNLQADLDLLERKIDEIGDVALVIIDPVSSYLGKTDSHKNSEVRGVLEPISEMAARKRVAILSVTHFSKSNSGTTTTALHRFIGSIAFIGAPRAAFAVIEDPENEGRMLFLHAKNNMASPPQGLAFRLEQRLLDGLLRAVSCIVWDSEPVAMTANQALSAGDQSEPTAKEDAVEFLRTVLTNGPLKVAEIEAEARAACLLRGNQSISQSKPFRAARKKLGITPFQLKGQRAGGWLWALPGYQMPSDGSDALH